MSKISITVGTALLLLLAACQQAPVPPTATPEPTPTPTATATPKPSPTPTPIVPILTTERTRQCLFNKSCSGLFHSDTVTKALPLRGSQGNGQYWLDPAGPDNWKRVIRQDVMPTLEAWTATTWSELYAQRPPGDQVLQWYATSAATYADGSGFYCHHDTVACAPNLEAKIIIHPGYDLITHINPDGTTQTTYAVVYPDEILRETALHEALHALYGARHITGRGLMCVTDECYRNGRIVHAYHAAMNKYVALVLTMQPRDELLYTLYGNPALTHGMSKAQAELIIQARPPE